MKKVIILLFLLLIISGCGPQDKIDKKTTECIASKSTLYIKTGCHYCDNQEKMFGEFFKYLNVINCIEEPGKCIKNNVNGVPTWIINNKQYKGVQSIEQLKEITGC